LKPRVPPDVHKNACACKFHNSAYLPPLAINSLCVPYSRTVESFMHLDNNPTFQFESQIRQARVTYRIRSAGLVSSPNRWDEKTTVFPPLSFRIRVNRSNRLPVMWSSILREVTPIDLNIPCSAVGSRAALGSSNTNNPNLSSSETTARINIRDLVRRDQKKVSTVQGEPPGH